MAAPGLAGTLWRSARPPFLLLAPPCVLLGLALASRQVDLQSGPVALTLGGAVAAHASVNWLNEWHDHRSGLDARTQRTPFSGGSGALQARPAADGAVLAAGAVALVLAMLAGLLLLSGPARGAAGAFVGVGLAGAALVVAYTPWATRQPWACLAAPGLGFGPLMVGGTMLAQGARPDAAAWLAAVLVGLLASGLLLLNQMPDVEADRSVGRRTLAVVRGRAAAAGVYGWLLVGVWLGTLAAVFTGLWPWTALALLALTLAVGLAILHRLARGADDMAVLQPALAWNVLMTLAAPLTLAWAFLAGR